MPEVWPGMHSLSRKSFGCRKFFFGGCLNGRLGCRFGCRFRGAARTTCAAFFLGAFFLEHVFVVVNKFNEAHLCVVAKSVAGFKDTCVSAVAFGDLGGYFAEEFADGSLF